MVEASFERAWRTPRNPFQGSLETGEMITSHVSGRSADIREIILGGQGAIIVSGAPRIGKTSLIRYLQRPLSAEWSWRNELEAQERFPDLDTIHFMQIDLTPLEGITENGELLNRFVAQCTAALQAIWQRDISEYAGQKGLRELLRRMVHENPGRSYFVMLDTIERLQEPDMPLLPVASKAQSSQERAMALLDNCGAIRLLVDLLDEFTQFGVILSIERPPSPKSGDQFILVSADLARFATMTLQTFTCDDTLQFLAQEPESFGAGWARQFRDAGGDTLFSKAEQTWLYEQAGAHPYLLQQYCFHTFHLKREYAIRQEAWTELQKSDQDQLIERVNERVSTFLDRTWKRLKESLESSSQDTRNRFYDFMAQIGEKRADEQIDVDTWNGLGSELRYILYSEGVVRYDLLQPIYYPGATLLHYLTDKAKEQGKPAVIVPPSLQPITNTQALPGTNELLITPPGKPPTRLELSLLEFHLMKTLLRHPERCTEQDLMIAAWSKIIDKPVFTQRMHHLRKKLREYSEGEEVIENRYGGVYLLKHSDWFRLV